MDLVVFHQCYNQRKATDFAVQQFRLHNPDYPYYLVSDGGEDFSDIASKHNVNYCYEQNITMNVMNGETALKVVDRIRKYFELSNSKYLFIMEDDIWCRGRIDFEYDFNALGANSTLNVYYDAALKYVADKYKITIKNNFFNLCGGSILNRNIFFDHYDLLCNFLKNDHDAVRLMSANRTQGYEYGGWDSTFNMLYNVCEKEVGINPELTETWRDKDWRTNNKKLVHWYKENYINGEQYRRFYL